jgi:hypothetical protein
MTIGKISAAPLRRAALLGALLSASVAGVALAQDQVSSPAGVSVAADTVSQLQAATTPEQVNDIIAVASINMTPDQIRNGFRFGIAHADFRKADRIDHRSVL